MIHWNTLCISWKGTTFWASSRLYPGKNRWSVAQPLYDITNNWLLDWIGNFLQLTSRKPLMCINRSTTSYCRLFGICTCKPRENNGLTSVFAGALWAAKRVNSQCRVPEQTQSFLDFPIKAVWRHQTLFSSECWQQKSAIAPPRGSRVQHTRGARHSMAWTPQLGLQTDGWPPELVPEVLGGLAPPLLQRHKTDEPNARNTVEE